MVATPEDEPTDVPPGPIQPLKVFLCHSSKDKPAVRRLYKWLRAEGVEPWFDEESLQPGENWKEKVLVAIRTSDVVIVCLSRHSTTEAGFVQKEISDALDVAEQQPEDTIYIIPVRLEECQIPERLRRWHVINLFDARGYERLLGSLWSRARALPNRLLFTTWPDTPIARDEFSGALVKEVNRVTEAVVSILLNSLVYPSRASHDAELMKTLNSEIARIELRYNCDIDITCLDEDRRYFVHPAYPQIVGSPHERIWVVSQGPTFSDWFWTRVTEMERGLLTWTDIIGVTKDYTRKTMVSFRRLVLAPAIIWTVAIEGHELSKRRK